MNRFKALKLFLSGLLGLAYAFFMCWQLSINPVWWLGLFYYAIPASAVIGSICTVMGFIKIINPSLCSWFDERYEGTEDEPTLIPVIATFDESVFDKPLIKPEIKEKPRKAGQFSFLKLKFGLKDICKK